MPECRQCDFESPSERMVQIHFEVEHKPALIEFIRRGQEAQKAVDQILEEHSDKTKDAKF
jgi:hypothetical protein